MLVVLGLVGGDRLDQPRQLGVIVAHKRQLDGQVLVDAALDHLGAQIDGPRAEHRRRPAHQHRPDRPDPGQATDLGPTRRHQGPEASGMVGLVVAGRFQEGRDLGAAPSGDRQLGLVHRHPAALAGVVDAQDAADDAEGVEIRWPVHRAPPLPP